MGSRSGADLALLPGTADAQASAAADVFYLHAGVNFLRFDWNGAVDSRTARLLVDGPYMERFASVWSPRISSALRSTRLRATRRSRGRHAAHRGVAARAGNALSRRPQRARTGQRAAARSARLRTSSAPSATAASIPASGSGTVLRTQSGQPG